MAATWPSSIVRGGNGVRQQCASAESICFGVRLQMVGGIDVQPTDGIQEIFVEQQRQRRRRRTSSQTSRARSCSPCHQPVGVVPFCKTGPASASARTVARRYFITFLFGPTSPPMPTPILKRGVCSSKELRLARYASREEKSVSLTRRSGGDVAPRSPVSTHPSRPIPSEKI